jgi:crotonobetainyl-CoA:carnitine CoA-transferase CaiB-like acyl-CoA transferase
VRLFADHGARVIKVEIPEGAPGGDDMIGAREHDRADFENLHRNKESLTLNLKDPEGLKIFWRLIAKGDVLVENFRPDVKYKLGIGPDDVLKANPRIVYASISGFGQEGPYAQRPGFDSIAQGMGGLMSVTGKPDEEPMRVGIPIADLCAGHFLSMAILVALLDRDRTGKGQWVHTSLLEAQIAMLDFQAAQWLVGAKVPTRVGNEHPLTVPTGVFKTKDGHINVAAIGQTMWVRLCSALGVPGLAHEPGLETDVARVQNRHRVNEAVEAALRTKTTADWIAILNEMGVPAGPIYSIKDMFADPQVRELKIEWPIDHPKLGKVSLVGQPIHLSNYPRNEQPRPSPDKAQHTDAILQELGYAESEILALREKHVV